MEVCGEAENRLASELMQHELQIEKDVLDPLSQLAEVRLSLPLVPPLVLIATHVAKSAEVPGNTPRLLVISGTRRDSFLCSRVYCRPQMSHCDFCDVMCKCKY